MLRDTHKGHTAICLLLQIAISHLMSDIVCIFGGFHKPGNSITDTPQI